MSTLKFFVLIAFGIAIGFAIDDAGLRFAGLSWKQVAEHIPAKEYDWHQDYGDCMEGNRVCLSTPEKPNRICAMPPSGMTCVDR